MPPHNPTQSFGLNAINERKKTCSLPSIRLDPQMARDVELCAIWRQEDKAKWVRDAIAFRLMIERVMGMDYYKFRKAIPLEQDL